VWQIQPTPRSIVEAWPISSGWVTESETPSRIHGEPLSLSGCRPRANRQAAKENDQRDPRHREPNDDVVELSGHASVTAESRHRSRSPISLRG
jgi:hypothetical protein